MPLHTHSLVCWLGLLAATACVEPASPLDETFEPAERQPTPSEPSPAVPSPASPDCAAGDTFTEPCGLNGRGLATTLCNGPNGTWGEAGRCADSDVCVDLDLTELAEPRCDFGAVSGQCVDGQWQALGACPSGWAEVHASQNYTCGLTLDGEAYCWGMGFYGHSDVPEGRRFDGLVTTPAVACGYTDDTLTCWGDNPHLESPRDALELLHASRAGAPIHALDASPSHACVLLDHEVRCVIDGVLHSMDPLGFEDGITDIAVTDELLEIIDGEGMRWHRFEVGVPPPGEGTRVWPRDDLHSVDLGPQGTSCFVATDGALECWSEIDAFNNEVLTDVREVSVGWGYLCAVHQDQSIECLGENNVVGRIDPVQGQVAQIDAGTFGQCFRMLDGTLECRMSNTGVFADGTESTDATEVPETAGRSFVDVAYGGYHICAIDTEGELVCWGYDGFGQGSPPEDRRYIDVGAGYNFSCAIDEDLALHCFGRSRFGQTNAPAGRFVSVAVGEASACAIEEDGALRCWGRALDNTPTQGRFSTIRVEGASACALDLEGHPHCWGGAPTPPADAPALTSLALHHNDVCGVSVEGETLCWSDGSELRSMGWDHESVDGGGGSICGLRSDGTAHCWGMLSVDTRWLLSP